MKTLWLYNGKRFTEPFEGMYLLKAVKKRHRLVLIFGKEKK